MHAPVFYQPGDVRIEERPEPAAGTGQLLVDVHACGVCGADRHVYEGAYPARFPVAPGHEFAGTIVDVGPGVAGFSRGDRIAIDPNIPVARTEEAMVLHGSGDAIKILIDSKA